MTAKNQEKPELKYKFKFTPEQERRIEEIKKNRFHSSLWVLTK